MVKLIRVMLTGAAVLAVASPALANPGYRGLPFFGRTPVPAFQAAPWYLYWPYDGHFQTPAPLMGAFYAPPGGGYGGFGGGMPNPYFPAPGVYFGGTPAPSIMPATPATIPGVMPAAPATLPGNVMPAVVPNS